MWSTEISHEYNRTDLGSSFWFESVPNSFHELIRGRKNCSETFGEPYFSVGFFFSTLCKVILFEFMLNISFLEF